MLRYFKYYIYCLFSVLVACGSNGEAVNTNGGVSVTKDSKGRVKASYDEKIGILKDALNTKGLTVDSLQIFMRVFKKEQRLEIFARNDKKQAFQLIKTYPFCTFSGELGPKRKEGDRQIPEGLYYIDRFNARSSYYLSLGINYPNAADKILGDPNRPGSDIFIHGACASVGCVSITDDLIKEVYTFANIAREAGQERIEVHFYPMDFEQGDWKSGGEHASLWNQLYQAYSQFNADRQQLPKYGIDKDGKYIF